MRVCFISYHAYPLFDPQTRGLFGGAETHAWLLARGLSRLPEFDVHFVILPPCRFRSKTIDRIRVWNIGDIFDRMRVSFLGKVEVLRRRPWLRVRQWRPSLLWEVPTLAAVRMFRTRRPDPRTPHPLYGEIDADVHCCFGVSRNSATAIASARQTGRKSVLFLESNNELDERFTEDSDYVTPYGERGDICHFVLTAADCVIAQNSVQQELLARRIGRESLLMTNALDLEWWDRMADADSPALRRNGDPARYVLWIGRADRFHKRPDLCLELARRCPELQFLMLLNPRDLDVERAVRAHHPPNVTIVRAVPFHEMPAMFSRAAAFVSTGSAEYEGSPNVFLQAAASRVPVGSLEVSSDLLEEVDCGFVAGGDVDRLADYLRAIWRDPRRGRIQGERGREYVERRYDLRLISSELATTLGELVAPARPLA